MNQANQLLTRWGKELDPEHVLQEYPRPQMVRKSYCNLNGVWDCAFTDCDGRPEQWESILVPFSPEAPLSGVNRALKPGEYLWYRRMLPALDAGDGRILLHFGAVDQEAAVFVNGEPVAFHQGGYTPFTADITDVLKPTENELLVKVQDDTDASWHSRGKQKTERGGIWYTPQSGIWQTVWMERVPAQYITGLRITPVFDEHTVELTVWTTRPEEKCQVLLEGRTYDIAANVPQALPVARFTPWSPENPKLYSFAVRAGEDCVESYFAMRKVEVRADKTGVKRLFLNNQPYFQTGLLDQGYYPDGLYTAPSDEAIQFDIQTAKKMGFNMLRKHIKVEPLRWYYHCDRLGILVWQDMVNGGRSEYNPAVMIEPMLTGKHQRDDQYALFGRQDAEGREAYYRELEETVRLLYNSPSVVTWVPFNEGWGQFDAAEAVRRIEALDKTRTIDHASGWNDQGIGSFKSQHVYFIPYQFKPDQLGRAVVLSEYGGYALRMEGHTLSDETFGYQASTDPEALQKLFSQMTQAERQERSAIVSTQTTAEGFQNAFVQLMEQQILPAKQQGLAAAVYTQLTDVEGELNGLITYDREVLKLPVEVAAACNALLRD